MKTTLLVLLSIVVLVAVSQVPAVPPVIRHTQLFSETIGPFSSLAFSNPPNPAPKVILNITSTGHDVGSDSLELTLVADGNSPGQFLNIYFAGLNTTQFQQFVSLTPAGAPASAWQTVSTFAPFVETCVIAQLQQSCLVTVHHAPVTVGTLYILSTNEFTVSGRHTWTVTTAGPP